MKKPSRFSRFMSLNQHRRRMGARHHTQVKTDTTRLKSSLVSAGETIQIRGSEKSLDKHLANLRKEFSGQSELLWHHAKLIVLIRREYHTSKTYNEFRSLWEQESAFLLQHLSMRWLISATDTFTDHDKDANVRAAAMLCSMLTILVNMQESERFLVDAANSSVNPQRVSEVQADLVPLFDGMSCFTVGTDDTLRNMRWRLQPFTNTQPTGPILAEIWRRLQIEDTVFNRMRVLHTRDKNRWW